MKIKVEMSPKEKKIAMVAGVIVLLILFYFNKKYIYLLDVEFEENNEGLMPSNILIKSGFIFPVKTELSVSGLEEKKVRWYGYTLKVVKGEDSPYELLLNDKVIRKLYSDSYYEDTKTKPTGLVKN